MISLNTHSFQERATLRLGVVTVSDSILGGGGWGTRHLFFLTLRGPCFLWDNYKGQYLWGRAMGVPAQGRHINRKTPTLDIRFTWNWWGMDYQQSYGGGVDCIRLAWFLPHTIDIRFLLTLIATFVLAFTRAGIFFKPFALHESFYPPPPQVGPCLPFQTGE